MRDFSLPLTVYVVRSTSRAAGDSAEGHVPRDQNPNNTSERGESVYTGLDTSGGPVARGH